MGPLGQKLLLLLKSPRRMAQVAPPAVWLQPGELTDLTPIWLLAVPLERQLRNPVHRWGH